MRHPRHHQTDRCDTCSTLGLIRPTGIRFAAPRASSDRQVRETRHHCAGLRCADFPKIFSWQIILEFAITFHYNYCSFGPGAGSPRFGGAWLSGVGILRQTGASDAAPRASSDRQVKDMLHPGVHQTDRCETCGTLGPIRPTGARHAASLAPSCRQVRILQHPGPHQTDRCQRSGIIGLS